AANKINPLEHFVLHGWKEGRNPAPWFSTRDYLQLHRDVRQSGINPFYHYIVHGRNEKRSIVSATHPYQVIVDPSAQACDNPELRDMMRYPERPIAVETKTFDPARLKIHWVIPDFSAGGGGHMTIFRMVRWLELFGHDNTVWINHDTTHPAA